MSRDDGSLPKGRLEAFADALYPIAITLLVLELHVPESSDRLWEHLTGAWPSFLGYLVSFAFIGSSWLNHTILTRYLTASDCAFVGINLILLLFVSFLPFTTGVMATHLTGPGQRLAVVLFGVNMTLADVMMAVVYAYAARNENLVNNEGGAQLRELVKTRWLYTVLFGLSTIVGAFLPLVALGFYLAISAFILAAPLQDLRRSKPARERDRKRRPHIAASETGPGRSARYLPTDDAITRIPASASHQLGHCHVDWNV